MAPFDDLRERALTYGIFGRTPQYLAVIDTDKALSENVVRTMLAATGQVRRLVEAAEHDLREWREILQHYSRQRIKDFLIAETPRAERLRQSSPFFAVLTPVEREEL